MSVIRVIFNPPGGQTILPGSSSELRVVVSNQNQQPMVIQVELDNLQSPLRQWCQGTRESFNLDVQRSQEVIFRWKVPVQALPGTYDYDVVVDAPASLNAPLRHQLQLQVLPPLQTPVRKHDPTFRLQPFSTSTSPITLQVGQSLTLQAIVNNRSNQVDRFRLSCPDLEEDWYTIRYPEGIKGQGLVTGGNALDLNKGDTGQITLIFHPPANTLAGNYSPTLLLHSQNNLDLLLQEIVYLYVPPIHNLQVQLQSLLSAVRQSSGRYKIELLNEGNTIREVAVQVRTADEEDCCDYRLEQTQTRIPPKKKVEIGLEVQPTQRAKQPFLGAAKSLNFWVDFEDLHQEPLPNNVPLKGTLWWQPRPWWQLLCLILAGLLSLGSLAFLIWLIFLQPREFPSLTVESEDNSYQYNPKREQEIELVLTLTNVSQAKSLNLIVKEVEAQKVRAKIQHEIKKLEKASNCHSNKQKDSLVCNNLSTGAREPGKYEFVVQLFAQENPNGKPIVEEVTGPVTIEAPPHPTLETIDFEQSEYVIEVEPTKPIATYLTLEASHLEEIQEIKIFKNSVLNKTVSAETLQNEQVCNSNGSNRVSCRIPVELSEVGNHTYSVEVVPTYKDRPSDRKEVPIAVEEAKVPLNIVQFTINGQSEGPVKLQPNERPTVSWEVKGKNVKVSITNLSGTLPEADTRSLQPFPEGTFQSITLQATDAYGQTATQELSIQVESPPSLENSSGASQSPSTSGIASTLPAPQSNRESSRGTTSNHPQEQEHNPSSGISWPF